MIPQALVIVKRFDNDENWSMDMALYSIGSSTVYDKSNRRTNYDHCMASSLCVKGIFNMPDIERAWISITGQGFTEIRSKWKPHDWAFDNCTSCVFKGAVKTTDSAHSVRAGCGNLQLKDINKWNNLLISFADQVRSSNKKLPISS